MKLRLFLLILILIGAVTIGLFFPIIQAVLTGEAINPVGLDKNPVDGAINKISDVPDGDPQLKKQIKVDLFQQKAFLYENGRFVREFAISSGKIETPTPTGNFRVIYKQDMVYSKPTGCWLSFWAGFTSDGKYGFHETPICEGKREGEDKMGTPASAGCIRLKLGDAEEFYNWVETETPVEVF